MVWTATARRIQINIVSTVNMIETEATAFFDENRSIRTPDNAGVYYLRDVSNLLRATDHVARADEFSLSPQQISGWARKGFADVQKAAVFSNYRFVRFLDLITLRMVAILRSHGISLVKVTLAHNFLTDALSTSYPFVNRALWVDDTDVSEDVYAEVDHLLVTASRHGQIPFSELLATKIVRVAKMTYDDQGDAATWHPHDGVTIDPRIHSGAPCLDGTRISTGLLYNMHISGEPTDGIADWYELDLNQVESAIQWEERLAA